MSEIQIDHEAAMRLANIGANAGNSTPHGKVSRAYIDSQRQLAAAQDAIAQQDKCLDDAMGQLIEANKQLAAERARVQKLAKLVRDAYEMDHCFYDDYIIGEPIPFEASDAARNLAAILNAHAQGDEQ